MDYSVEEVDVQGRPMEVFLFEPQRRERGTLESWPGLVLAQHIPVGHTGIENDEFTLATARRYAENGFYVAVPFIFHWWPKSESMEKKKAESSDQRMVADMTAAFSLLADRDGVDPERIGIAGHCWGGRVAWLAACRIADCKALAVFYGGNIKKAMGGGGEADGEPPIRLAGNIPCPVIGFFGNDDANPSPADVEDYSDALAEAGVSHEFHQYDGAGHAFQNFPSAERYREEASEDAWRKALAFFREKLKPARLGGTFS